MRKNRAVSQEKEFSILTLDDDKIMTLTLQSYFQALGFYVDAENDPFTAIERIRTHHYDILLLDFLMRPVNGDEVVRRVREFNKDIFIILLTGHKSMAPPLKTIRELDIQGYYEKSDRFDQLELLVESCSKSIKQMRIIRQQNEELNKAYMETVDVLRKMVDAKDFYTRGHSDRVSYYAVLIGEAMGKDAAYVERLRIGGLFHDIGKIGVPDAILQKPSRLTGEEYARIRRHTTLGKQMLLSVSALHDILPMVESHHEWYNGSGYPAGIAGEVIAQEARIISVADAFDAMTSKRTYRTNLTLEEAVTELKNGKGTQFDPVIVDAFIGVIDRTEDILDRLKTTFTDMKE